MRQLPLDLHFLTAQGREDFILGNCNRLAAAWIDRWPDWPGPYPVLNIVGPPASGKSHLAAVWQSASRASIAERANIADTSDKQAGHFILDHPQPVDAEAEQALFHQFNALSGAGSSMLILSHIPVAQMGWSLPDLASRMRSVNMVRLDPPDDVLLRALMEKYFSDRQLAVMPAVLDYMVTRIERSFAAVQTIAAAMDRESLAQRRSLTMKLAREIMENFASVTRGGQARLPLEEDNGN